ncbi:Na+/H+ antiporter [Solicola gregarius]|uniref:Na+/H+ antiporter n=1 Tax=Solicola gregarius TaxID=2908642 RepID=A0AA46TJ15_9ACTN|nr:Na+/H+ antiporter [Solicola gregarius]UYM06211.1 Na+/H+ antiporter [Solicola gregarius]
MHIAVTMVVLVTCVVAVSALARRVGFSAPLVLVVAGFVGSYLPFIPDVALTPDLVLIGLLPPLLYAAAIRTSLIDFRRNKRPIGLLSVGLVVFTTLGVGLTVWWLLPVPLAAALALGAVVAPPDAVAATSIARKAGMPRRIVTILEGESLVNDATALVTLRTAVAAMGAGGVTVWSVGLDFLVSAVGAAAIGVVVAVVIGWVRKRVTDTLTDVSISILTPWIAYIPAEEIHSSGVLAVVVAGLLLGHRSPVIQSASSRVFERTIWATIGFLLENTVFLLIGLQVRTVIADLGDSDLAMSTIVWSCVAALVAAIVLRFCWVFPATYLPRLIPAVRRTDPSPPWQFTTIVAWAGMRGVVTLAAVFLLPEDTPHREVFVAIAFFVTAGTLLIQGLTLPSLVRRLDLPAPDPQEDHLQEATVYQRAARAGLQRLDEELTGDEPQEVVDRLRQRSLDRANAVWERLGGSSDPPSVQYAKLREIMLESERGEVLRIRRNGHMDQTVLRHVLDALDVEETILDRSAEDTTAEREVELVPSGNRGKCEDLRTYVDAPRPRTPEGCEQCLKEGMSWVHLRECMVCGYIGCCDSSPGTHATKHWEESEHPVMRSFEPGEAWRWCFPHHVTG